MRDLELVGLSEDGRRVVFVDDTGAKFGAPADDRLRAALRGDRARLGQLEIEMDSVLRPRDIQSRIRAGETPEAVAALAQVPVDRIMPFCVPVLAERSHVATLARRSSVRRKNAEGPARSLGDLVAERLGGRGVDPATAVWDAWRRDDGRWQISLRYRSGERPRAALFVFDSRGRYAIAEDDEAKWLTGERQGSSKGPQPREGGRPEAAGGRRLSAVPAGEDLLSLADEESTDDLTAVVRAVREHETAERSEREPPDVPLEVAPDRSTRASTVAAAVDAPASDPSNPPGPPGTPAASSDLDAAGGTAEAAGARRRRGPRRASVPSWDEIMLRSSKDS